MGLKSVKAETFHFTLTESTDESEQYMCVWNVHILSQWRRWSAPVQCQNYVTVCAGATPPPLSTSIVVARQLALLSKGPSHFKGLGRVE